jgi:type II pantothenate kinase
VETEGSEDESEAAAAKDEGTSGDDWWWSRKVQRDVISYNSTFPYLLVTIGTGVSILRVDGPRQHERVSGSTIGGGTYWGLIRLLTDVDEFEDAMRLAERGDPSKVDMMVGDIYGKNSGALEKFGLSANLVASSFGKLIAKKDPALGLKQEDLARALLLMVTINIGQVAYLNAKMHKTPRIYFVGNFLRGNKISQRRLSFAIDYWSKGEMEALFLEHEGYFGALGAFLLSQGISHDEQGFFQWGSQLHPTLGKSGSSEDLRSESKHRRTRTASAALYL